MANNSSTVLQYFTVISGVGFTSGGNACFSYQANNDYLPDCPCDSVATLVMWSIFLRMWLYSLIVFQGYPQSWMCWSFRKRRIMTFESGFYWSLAHILLYCMRDGNSNVLFLVVMETLSYYYYIILMTAYYVSVSVQWTCNCTLTKTLLRLAPQCFSILLVIS